MTTNGQTPQQMLFFVFGGELEDVQGVAFRDPSKLDLVGVFPDKASALSHWRAKAHQSVDNAHMRYFVVDLHKLLEIDCGAS